MLLAIVLLPIFWIGLRVLSWHRVLVWLDRSAIFWRTHHSINDWATIGALANIAGKHVPFGSTCLTRSLALTWLLRRHSVSCELRIGVRFVQGNFEAHAWVEHEGTPINDTNDVTARFAMFREPILHKLFSRR